ncbi:spermatocyte protein spe-8-like [Oratosquilla oratoria]|uniref:spermatocyte protein spe-8-like n=1 Tax=Oratosquilla oratoria TaxID=337810 RepID=UPI003F76AB23
MASLLVMHSTTLLSLVEASKRLGEGTFAVAFVGLLKGRPVCTKAYKERASAQKKMQKEAGILQLLVGLSGVPRLLHVCPSPLAILTSFDGDYTLEAMLLQKPSLLTEIDVVDVLLQVVSNLRGIHARYVSHNDIKWDNIVLRQEKCRFVATVIDFGSACHIGQTPYRPCDEKSFPHLAPEIARGGVATFRSDVYSMGHVMERVLSHVSMTSTHKDIAALVAAARRPQPEDRISLGALAAKLSSISQELSKRHRGIGHIVFDLLREVGSRIWATIRSLIWG